ncbi:ADP-ribosylglycohydrolase family protein [Neoroseomonas marina]|uniref:ADP-ribosylglycohydrolase family protein n=1 Tax=Neoroseomonas marina TaxID=1232220 RepID=UPI001B7D6ADF|nr:ADP-ribosylglycohydrolase family protein [Neoroseomonas marina]
MTTANTVADPGKMLDRAQGCLLGQAIGDALGALVEFQSPADIRRRYPGGVRDLADGGTWNTLAGQPTDDTELALALARVLADADSYDPENVVTAYAHWYRSGPCDMGTTTARALRAAGTAPAGQRAAAARQAANPVSQANGSLMRIAAIGIWARSPAEAAATAAEDSRLTHPHPVCAAACAAMAAAIATGVAGGDRGAMVDAALDAAEGSAAVREALRAACGDAPLPDAMEQQGWVLVALQHAFRSLVRGTDVEQALVTIVGQGGDTDTNATIAGALLGAAVGRSAWPSRDVTLVDTNILLGLAIDDAT